MERHASWPAAALFALGLAACNASTVSTPPTPAPVVTPANVAGQYLGTVVDTAFGHGNSLGDFSQTGSAVGGRLNYTFPSASVAGSAALTVSHGTALSGTWIATIGTVACSFSVTASYDPGSFVFRGTYAATHGCSGESGSFHLLEQCYYPQAIPATPSRSVRTRRNAGGLHPC